MLARAFRSGTMTVSIVLYGLGMSSGPVPGQQVPLSGGVVRDPSRQPLTVIPLVLPVSGKVSPETSLDSVQGVSANDLIRQALAANNYLAAVGQTKGSLVQVNLTADTGLETVEEFRRLVVRESGDALVRLEDVADVARVAAAGDPRVPCARVRALLRPSRPRQAAAVRP